LDCADFRLQVAQGENMKSFAAALALFVCLSMPALANVTVSSPQNGETVGSPAKFVASAITNTCSKGVASMGVYVDDTLEYVVNGTSINTSLALAAGHHNAVVQEWDYCGGATNIAIPITVSGQTGVWVTSPANNSTVSWLTNYVATATTDCAAGIAAMGIYVNNELMYVTYGAKLNTQMNLKPGPQHTVIQEWDNCGGSSTAPADITVVGSGNTLTNLQSSKGWKSWGQLAPLYADCSNPCSGVTWSMSPGVKSPSLEGTATQFNLGGTTPYSDVLFENPLIGQFSTQGLPDIDQKLLPTLHNFSYDAWFYLANPATTQAMEFDVNMFFNSVGMTWGTECRIRGGNEWDIWDNVNAKWVPTGVACNPTSNGWNHVTVNVQRGANNTLIFQSITLNGVTANINKTYAPFWVPADWYGITVNYQMDGDEKQDAITSYVDKFSFMYW
jgi:hypothetical protein